MARTQFNGTQVSDGSIGREDLNTVTAGSAVITKLIPGPGTMITFTGTDSGTGDVTITSTDAVSSVFGRTGDIIKAVGDYSFGDISGTLLAASFPALAGDVTNVAGSLATTLATVNANVGTFTSVTVNAKGLVTAASMVTSLIGTPLAATANTGYTDNTNYYGYATTANGFPIAGSFSGMRFGTTGTQRLQSEVVGSLWTRSWNNTAVAWSAWVLLLDSQDYTAISQITVGTANNTYSVLAGPTADGQVLTSSATATNGMGLSWVAPGTAVNSTTGANSLGTYIVQASLNAPQNAQILASLTTGILKSTTTTGVISIAVAADFPVLNQNTSGTASNITGVLAAASHPAHSGDATSPSGSLALTLATVNANIGTFNSVTVNAKGLVTAASAVASLPAGTTTQIQFNNAGVLAGSAFSTITAQGHLNLLDLTGVINTPASGVTLVAKTRAGRRMLGYMDSTGYDYYVQPFFGSNKITLLQHAGNSASVAAPAFQQVNMVTATPVGTATARNVTTANLFTSTKRLGLVSVATAGGSAELFGSVAQYFRGNALGVGGFYAVFRFGISDAATVAGGRMFVGFAASAAALPNGAVSALQQIIGVGYDSADTVLSIYTNVAVATATKVALPAAFVVNTLSTDMYELRLFAVPNTTTVGYAVERVNTGDLTSGTLSTNIPLVTTLMTPHFWRNNGATALAIGIDVMSLYIEVDN